MRQPLAICLAVVPFFAATIGQASAASISIAAGASPNIRNASPDTAFNSPTEVFAGRLDPNSWIRGLLDFDLSAIPDGATIDSVTLDLTINSVDGASDTGGVGADGIRLFNLTETFNTAVDGVTYNERDNIANTAWSTAGGTFDATPVSIIATPTDPDSVTVGEVFGFGSTTEFVDAVQGALAGDNLQLIVRTPSIESSVNSRKIYRFGSATNTDDLFPVLTVDFTVSSASVPEPSTLALMALGCTLLGFRRRRIR